MPHPGCFAQLATTENESVLNLNLNLNLNFVVVDVIGGIDFQLDRWTSKAIVEFIPDKVYHTYLIQGTEWWPAMDFTSRGKTCASTCAQMVEI